MFIEKIVNVTNLQIFNKALVFTVYLHSVKFKNILHSTYICSISTQCQTAKSTEELVSPKKGNTSDGFVPFDIKRSLIV